MAWILKLKVYFNITPPSLQLPTVSDKDLCAGLSALWSDRFDLLDHVHTLNNTAEYNVLSIQPENP